MKNYISFYEQVCVRKRTLEEIAANCDSRIQRMRSRQTQKHTNLVNVAYFQNGPTVDLMKRFHQYYDGQRGRRVTFAKIVTLGQPYSL
mgnify:CR=1 FL=1